MDPAALLASVKKMTPMHVGVGVVLGFVLSPVIAAILATLLPLALFVALLAAAAVAYAKFKLNANINDWRLLSGILVPRFQQLMAAKKNHTTDVYWYQAYDKVPESQPFIINADTGLTMTWGDAERLSNQVANFALDQKWPVNTTIGLMMPNRSEYVPMWLGNAKVGLVTALLNTNLRKQALIHCIKTGECKVLVYDAEYTDALLEIADELKPLNIALFQFDGTQEQANQLGATLLRPELARSSSMQVKADSRAGPRGAIYNNPVFYIYTSGTTGLPKAAKVSHHRLRLIGSVFGGVFVKASDRIYCSLPLYHSSAGLIGVGAAFQRGCTIVLRKKFSASGFAKDCVEHQATIVQYIGELCRYLLATPVNAEVESKLNIRLAIGNGLRPDVWKPFKSRFRVQQIGEFYGATEGTTALFNVGDVDFSVGYMSPIVNLLLPMALVKFDQEKEEIIRGPDGRCINCAPGETGEFIGKIVKAHNTTNFSGYTDKAASDKKILRNVFVDGDEWFRSGDLLRRDEHNNVFFCDRIGDTFRWKGENVATSEVAQVLGTFKSGLEANVYGVEIPKQDGRAGMAAITGTEPKSVDFDALAQHLIKELPRYAIPIFLRFLPAQELTSTFKHQKVSLRNAGFDTNTIKDPMYFFDGKTYVPLTADVHGKIVRGEIRL